MNTDKIIAEKIASEYAPKETSKLVALKKLDRKAKRPAEIFAYTFGIISSLVAGTGMCLSMGAISIGQWTMAAGIIIGIAGFIDCGINYPLYKKILEKSKAKYAYDIVRLAQEIAENK